MSLWGRPQNYTALTRLIIYNTIYRNDQTCWTNLEICILYRDLVQTAIIYKHAHICVSGGQLLKVNCKCICSMASSAYSSPWQTCSVGHHHYFFANHCYLTLLLCKHTCTHTSINTNKLRLLLGINPLKPITVLFRVQWVYLLNHTLRVCCQVIELMQRGGGVNTR